MSPRLVTRRRLLKEAASLSALAVVRRHQPAAGKPRYSLGACDWSLGMRGRTEALKVAKELGREAGNTVYGDIADILEKTMLDRKNIHPNVDFPAAYAYYLLGIPVDLYTPIFVVSRVSGWSAHAIEQLRNNRLIRPTAIYEGGQGLAYVAEDRR